tara:strand:- start:24 stop:794 length:771 start_codon:yes stop_codon:yes gene_type:complete
MIGYVDLLSLIPAVFLILSLPIIRKRFFIGVDIEKFAYGAVTTGILLTFYGIWIGLLGFDTTDIAGSIPNLLNGLKTAFSSSLVGLGTSLLINLLFVESQDTQEKSLADISKQLEDLNNRLEKFTVDSADANVQALMEAINTMIEQLEVGINTETHDVMKKFRQSVETLHQWQSQYIEEIQSVTDAMDRNAEVTKTTTAQLDRTNDVLAELGPVTETIAQSIGWVQNALPSFRPKRRVAIDEDINNPVEETIKDEE